MQNTSTVPDPLDQRLAVHRAAFASAIEELRARLPEPPAAPPPDTRLQSLQREQQLALEQRREELAALQQKIDEEKQQRRAAERDVLIREALIKVGCRNLTGGARYVLPSIRYEEEDGGWIYQTKDGLSVSIPEGIAKELPSYLRLSAPTPAAKKTTQALARKEQELAAAKEKVEKHYRLTRNTGARTADLLEHRRLKDRVEALEREVAELRG